jgi:hypothetical protein
LRRYADNPTPSWPGLARPSTPYPDYVALP